MAFRGVLVSSGFSSPAILGKVRATAGDRGYAKAHIITTAHPKKERAPWNGITKQQLEDMGLTVSFVDFDAGESIDDDADLLYVCGGNTFRLLHGIRTAAAPIRDQIASLCDRGGLYVGSSAGAVIVGPDITSAGEIHPDKNHDGITDLTGLRFIPRHVIPHYTPAMDAAVAAFRVRHGIPADAMLLLRDGEGVSVADGRYTYIS